MWTAEKAEEGNDRIRLFWDWRTAQQMMQQLVISGISLILGIPKKKEKEVIYVEDL